MNRISVFLLLMILGWAVPGCFREPPAAKVSLKKNLKQVKMFSPAQKDVPLQFAVSTMISPEETIVYYKRILDYVAAKLGRDYVLIQKNSYSQVNELFREGALDLAFVCSGPYVDLASTTNMDIIAVPVVNGSPTYRSYIIVPASSDVRQFSDLKGKTFAFVDPLSNTGRYYPLQLVYNEVGSLNEYFRNYIYSYSHSESIRLVRDNNVDGAAVNSLIFDFMALQDPMMMKEVRIIVRSPAYAGPPFVAPANMEPALKKNLRYIFLNMHRDFKGRSILKQLNIQKFTVLDDSRYDSVRQLYESIQSHGEP